MHEDTETWTIDTVAVFVVAADADAADDEYDNDDGEKEILHFIKYYFSSTCIFATDIHLLKLHCLKMKVPHSNEINTVHNKCSTHTLLELLHVYNYVTKLCRHQAKVIESN